MNFRSARRLLCLSASIVSWSAFIAAVPATAASAQITGADQLGDSLPYVRALRVLREMQKDSVRVDSRHHQAAQRCDRAAMAGYLGQLNDLAAQARNVLRNSGLDTMQSIHNEQGHRIVENIEMRARHAASREPKNCGEPATQEPGGTTGTAGGSQSGSTGEQLVELQKESVRLNSQHYQAAERCDRAEMERIQAELDRVADEAGRIMSDAATGPRGTGSARFRNAERIAHNIAARADEARKRQPKNCPEEKPRQGDRAGPPSGSMPQPRSEPPPEQDAPPPEEDPAPPGLSS